MAGQVKQNPEEATFAERMRSAMLARGIGLGRLSQATGITQRQLVNYRQGKHEPRDYYGQPTANASRIASALGVDVGWLVPPKSGDPDLQPAA